MAINLEPFKTTKLTLITCNLVQNQCNYKLISINDLKKSSFSQKCLKSYALIDNQSTIFLSEINVFVLCAVVVKFNRNAAENLVT